MNVYYSFKLTNGAISSIQDWLTNNRLLDKVTYDWAGNILTFESEEDSVAFYMKFGAEPYETLLDRMLSEEKDDE